MFSLICSQQTSTWAALIIIIIIIIIIIVVKILILPSPTEDWKMRKRLIV